MRSVCVNALPPPSVLVRVMVLVWVMVPEDLGRVGDRGHLDGELRARNGYDWHFYSFMLAVRRMSTVITDP